MKVLVTELIWEVGINELVRNGFEVEYNEHLWSNRELLLQKVKNVHGIIVRNQTKVDQELLDAAPQLKVIGRLGVGLDNINITAARNRNVKVVFACNANATSVAEYVMTAMLNVSRPLDLATLDIRNGGWDRKRFTGSELFDKTIGLIGLGEISHRVAKRAKAFGMNVIGYDPFVTEYNHIVSETGVHTREHLSELLTESDFLSLHVPLTTATKHMISNKELRAMKPTAYLINTSRGGIIDEEALAIALSNKTIAGAILDVLEVEPILSTNPLLQCENVWITPHIAGLTEESQVRTSLLVAKEVGKILMGETSLCVV